MSKNYELFSIEDDNLIIKEEGLNFLKSLKEKIILISFFSTLNEKKSANSIKLSILSNLTNDDNIQENNNLAMLYETKIKKESSYEKILLLDINCQTKHLLSELFFASSLFIFFIDGNINEEELSKFTLLFFPLSFI